MRFVIFLTLFCSLLTPFTIHSQSYNEKDKAGLRNLFRQPSSVSGKNNFENVGLSVGDTLSWYSTEAWLDKLQEPSALIYIDWEWDNQIPANLIRLEIKSFDESSIPISGVFDCSYFSELKELNCSNSSIRGLNLSESRNLEILNCSNNKLENLDTENCSMLKVFNCSNNQLTNLNLSLNFNLTDLNCSKNQISELDVTKNINLKGLFCANNNINKLDLPLVNSIEVLNCSNNRLSQLDVTKHEGLKLLSTSDNNFESINISNNKDLVSLYSSDNKIKSIDLSSNQGLILLNVSNNSLSDLNTGSNSILEYLYLPHNTVKNLNVTTNSQLLALNCSKNELSNLVLTNNPLIVDLDCSFNHIETISTPSTSNVHSFVCNDNALRLSTLPLDYIASAIQKLAYAPQAEIDGGEVVFDDPIDISSEYEVNSTVTTYNWIDENNTAISMTHESNGVFKAVINEEKIVFCEMVNSAFPLLALRYKVKTLKKDTTNIIENENNSSLVVFYDKYSRYLHVKASEAIHGIELFDALGRRILQEKHSEEEVNIPIQQTIQSGVYIVRVETATSKIISKKINIQ